MKTEAEIIREERMRLVPMICVLCGKYELVKGATGHYSHRSKPGAYLDNCESAVLHELLGTEVAVHLKDED